ncbi:hypothetical protein [Erwinia amylovora]|uniref:hypothetical protein n=1 Tax=Erwinia amylovora TaxID=552 RepID=UPI00211DEFAE|nr:hypothetical protein [Erwinia amylovora]
MDTPDTIANGMLALFTKEKSSGVGDYMVSALSGFASFPEDLLVLGRDFLDSDDRGRNQIDKIRLISLIKKGATSDDLKKLINLVINEYAKNLSVEQCSRLLLKLGASSAGSFAFKALFVNQIVSLFLNE